MEGWDIRGRLEQLVFTHLRDEAGEAGIVQEPLVSRLTGTSLGFKDVPADYLQAMKAAAALAGFARGLVAEYALEARGRGRSWLEIAEAFGIEAGEVDDLAVEAFERVAPPSTSRWADRYARWTCASCQQRVSDRGPFESHPVDNESGHAEDCVRHQGEIEEFLRRYHYYDSPDSDTADAGDDDATGAGESADGRGWVR